MDNNEDFVNDFVANLRNKQINSTLLLYSKEDFLPSEVKYKPKDVITSICNQVKAIQNADKMRKTVKNISELKKYKNNDFLPVNKLSTERQSHHTQHNKFETQCVSDTELIDIIEHAEALADVPKDMNQEFGTTFCQEDVSVHRQHDGVIDKCKHADKDNKEVETYKNDIKEMHHSISRVNTKAEKEITKDTYDISYPEKCNRTMAEKVNVIETNKNVEYEFVDGFIEENLPCPILNKTAPNLKSNTPAPFVFALESFEKFESIAIPIVTENLDFETAKKVLSTQKVSNELFIQTHAEPVTCDRDKSLSPILEIKKPNVDSVQENTITQLKNGMFIIEDSILFSSDEEDDIKNDKELPLTCALETSFYTDEDLDKIIQPGSIQISSKAKIILDSNINDLSLAELVEIMDGSYNHIAKEHNSVTSINIEPINKSSKIVENNAPMTIIDKTAKRKSINIFEKENDIYHNCNEENYLNDKHNLVKLIDNTYQNNKDEKEVINMEQDESFDCNDSNNLHKNTLDNFNIDDQIMKEFENNFIIENDTNNFITGKKNDKQIPVKFDKINENFNLNIVSFGGFKTANNKHIKISDRGLTKIKNTFEDIDLKGLIGRSNNINKDIHSENHSNFDIYLPSTSKQVIGFQTINNNIINDSDTALVKTRTTSYDIDNEDILSYKKEDVDQNLQNFNHNRMKIDLVISKSNDINKDEINDVSITKNCNNKEQMPKFTGFQTANNKPVVISKEALAKSKKIFQDIDKETETAHKFLEESYLYNEDKTAFKGFQTASNKSIAVSKEALTKSKKIFQDIDIETETPHKFLEESYLYNEDKTAFKGFQTVSNKSFAVSKDALTNSKKIFQDIDICDNNMCGLRDINDLGTGKNTFKGFKTASNKPVKVSSEALARTKNIFQDINLIDKDSNVTDGIKSLSNNFNIKNSEFIGFKTANNECVEDNNEAEIRRLFSDTENENTKKDLFHGFKTSSNKPVEISKNALAKSNKIFQDICEENYNYAKNESNLFAYAGFKTANNKPVEISKDALAKTKNIFQDIDMDKNFDTKFDGNVFGGFKTASNKKVNISEKALLHSKKIFDDIDLNIIEPTKPMEFEKFNTKNNNIPEEFLKKSSFTSVDNKIPENTDENNLDIEFLLNTEVVKDLEETFYNDDSPKSEKRPGSPILSCPNAKKRKKFVMPQATHVIAKPSITANTKNDTVYKFDKNFKNNKALKLKDVVKIEKSYNSEIKIDPYILNFRFDMLLDFEFGGKRNEIDSDIWTTDKIKKLFIECVNRKIIPENWIDNHLRLIIWKLISYEIVFPKTMNYICSIRNVLHQLKYRYDRELYNVERPPLRKILEKDEVASKRMVLCVVGFYVEGRIVSITNTTQNIEIILTDGWYTIKACTDRMIDKLVCDKKIIIGTKLVIHGAELKNSEEGVSPWEDTSSIRLKISGNSIKRAKWDTRLGFHGNGAILSRLSSVKAEGGKVSRLRTFVTRVYPMLYVEKFENGSTVTRSERLEHLHQMKYENDRQIQMEKLYEEVEKYSEQDFDQDSEGLDTERSNFDTGSQICRLMKKSKDPTEFRAGLTNTQVHLLQEHTNIKREKLIENLQRKVQDLIKKRGLNVNRNVVPLLKIRVVDEDKENISKAVITIWRPNESLLDFIKEGTWIDIYNVVPTAIRFSELQISAGRQSVFRKSKFKDIDKLKAFKRKPYTIKDLQNTTTTEYNEIDTAGFIFLIEPSTKEYENSKQLYQNVYLADENKNITIINFWGGIKKFGFENILDTEQIISCVNLQKRHGNTRGNMPQYRATEFTYFTKSCKIDELRLMTEFLTKTFTVLVKTKFIDDCVAVVNSFVNPRYGNTENVTPYRLNNSDYNTTKYKQFINTPLLNKGVDMNLNLTGLDFESTFKQTDTQELSPNSLSRKRRVNEKITKLQMYGEPPPLQPIHIINKSNIIHNSYKSPIMLGDTSVKNLPENNIVNRTFVKQINPIKLNFSNKEEDPFAEEFDPSPPLSLE